MPRFARCVFAVFLAVCCLTSTLACQAARAGDCRRRVRFDGGGQRAGAGSAKRNAGAQHREHDKDHDLLGRAGAQRTYGAGHGQTRAFTRGLVDVPSRGRDTHNGRTPLRADAAVRQRRGGVHRRPLRRKRRQRAVCPMDERKGESPRHGAHVICQPERARRSGARLLCP